MWDHTDTTGTELEAALAELAKAERAWRRIIQLPAPADHRMAEFNDWLRERRSRLHLQRRSGLRASRGRAQAAAAGG
jgi:hypothetical protein